VPLLGSCIGSRVLRLTASGGARKHGDLGSYESASEMTKSERLRGSYRRTVELMGAVFLRV